MPLLNLKGEVSLKF